MPDKIVIFQSENIKLFVSKFGHLIDPCSQEDIFVQKYTWETSNRLTLEVITLDAAIVGLQTPDRDYIPAEVLLVSGNLPEYMHYDEQNLTSSVQSKVMRRQGKTTWSERIWSPYINGSDLILTKVLLDECRNLMMRVRFSVSFNNVVRISYQVVSDRVQSLETTHRLVMNLGGRNAGYLSTYDHVVQVNGDGFHQVRRNRVRDHIVKEMADDLVDLRVAQHVGMAIYRSDKAGFNGVYKLSERRRKEFDARIIHAGTGRVVESYSDFGWVQFSTLDDLPDPDKSIAPFYASLGVKRIDQIFNLDGFIRSLVHLIEGDDEELSRSSLVSSLRSCSTMNDSIAKVLIDDLLLQNLEEKIRALKQQGILSIQEAREIIEHLLLMSLDQVDEFIQNAARECAQGVLEDLVSNVVTSTSSISISRKSDNSSSTLGQEVSSRSDSHTLSTETTLDDIEEQIFPEFHKHAGIVLQLTASPFVRKCKPRGPFSHPKQPREQGLVFNRSVLLKFGICKVPSNSSECVNKSDP
ncbi:hypothetical protein RP20_CCG018730 [Aedes albopictus]|nr:hypothetical protein RP20_CCG018730 [Aedes albopictus]